MPKAPSQPSDRRVTRASNAGTHPGIPDMPIKRVRGAGKAQKAAVEERKANKQEKRDNAVNRIGSFKAKKAKEAALDDTPRAIHTAKVTPRQLHRTTGYLELPRTMEIDGSSKDDMEIDPPSVAEDLQPGLIADKNVSVTEVSSDEDTPPKKKVRSVKAKEGIRVSIKSFIENEGGKLVKSGGAPEDDEMVPVSSISHKAVKRRG